MHSINRLLTATFLLATFTVLSLWNLWYQWVQAAGWNYTVIWLAFISLIFYSQKTLDIKKQWYWLPAIIMILLNFSLYEAIWIQSISIIILPLFIGIFFLDALQLQHREWHFIVICELLSRLNAPLITLYKPVRLLERRLAQNLTKASKLFQSIAIGIITLLTRP